MRKHHVALIVVLPVLHSLLGCGPGTDHCNHPEVLLDGVASNLVQLVRRLTFWTLQLTCSQFQELSAKQTSVHLLQDPYLHHAKDFGSLAGLQLWCPCARLSDVLRSASQLALSNYHRS